MKQEIVYKRSRKDIIMYLLLCMIALLGCVYAIVSNATAIGTIGLVAFAIIFVYLIVRLFNPNEILRIDLNGIKTKYTKGEYINWNDIEEIYMDMDTYKNTPVNVISINLKKHENDKKIKFSKAKIRVRGDYNVNLQYSTGNINDALKEIKKFYKKNIK